MSKKAICASDLMESNLITLHPDMEINQAMQIFVKNGISGAPVMQNSNLIGVVSEKDLLTILMGKIDKEFIVKTVSDVMNHNIETVRCDADIYEIALKFITSKVRRFPVLDKTGMLVGQISCGDLVKYLSKNT